MQISVKNAAVDLSGMTILSDVGLDIHEHSRIGIVGRNGCGKTTLLRLLSGELQPAKKPGADDTVFAVSGKGEIGVLSQMTFTDNTRTVTDEIRTAYRDLIKQKEQLSVLQQQMEVAADESVIEEYTALLERFERDGGFYFEKEYTAALQKFGFSQQDCARPLSAFSGGQRTKLAFLKLLLSKPDLLLLDEPTNHLDIEAVRWLEEYLRGYKNAFVLVSHDRMFLDRTVNEIVEIEYGKTTRYVGNYTDFARQKKEQAAARQKLFSAQQREIDRLQAVADRFRYKANKAAMAQSKLKQINRLEQARVAAPTHADERTFHATLQVAVPSAKDVLTLRNLAIGYDKPLSTVSMEVLRGDRIGIVGGNGLGKSTLLETLNGNIPALGGEFCFGAGVKSGYFNQQMARYVQHHTLFDDFLSEFPSLNDYAVRTALGAFLFTGDEVFKTLDMLSGGEQVRYALCKLFQRRPNVLFLDEPTNHMDILGKETLECLLESYDGTLIFVSHDRYFVQKLATRLLVFQNGGAEFYPYGYAQYEAAQSTAAPAQAQQSPRPKKSYITPGKARARAARALQRAEERVAMAEETVAGLKAELSWEENASDYLKLSALQEELSAAEETLSVALSEWERAAEVVSEQEEQDGQN